MNTGTTAKATRATVASTLAQISFLFLIVAACGLLSFDALAQTSDVGQIQGSVARIELQGAAEPLSGIVVKLTPAGSASAAASSTMSDADGRYQFTGLQPGAYQLQVNVQGFNPFAATVTLQAGESRKEEIRLELAPVSVSVEVQAQSSDLEVQSSDPDATLTERQFPALPMTQQKYTEALPLVPGVVRTLDGTVSMKGSAQNQGMLLVDSVQMVDPVTGAFSVGVPLASIDTLNVYSSAYNAQYGGYSGGLAAIETKAPPSEWRYSLMDFMPGARMKNGHFAGISAETPRAFVGGPLIKNKLSISEAFDYTLKNRPVRGQPWPVNENLLRGFTSFTNLQAILSPRSVLTASLTAFSDRVQFADISSLVPQTASSNSGSKGAFMTLGSATQFSSGTLSTAFRYTHFKSNAYGQGDQDLLMHPDGMQGNAFNRWTRTANQVEFLPSFQLARKKWLGSHDLKVGSDVVHQWYDGTSHSNPIQILRLDRSVAERVDFVNVPALNGDQTEASWFVQDHWTVNDRLGVDAGARLTTQSNGRTAGFAPRFGVAYALTRDHKTVLRAGTGIFYDRVSQLAATFTQNPARMITRYDLTGSVAGGPVILQNAYVDSSSRGTAIRTSGDPGTSPRDLTWNVEVERELSSRVGLRVGYLQSQTSRLYVVTPWADTSGANAVMALNHDGDSHYREFQARIDYRAGKRAQFTTSYLRTKAKGSLNTLSNIYAPFEQPVIRPNVSDYYAFDVPHRLLSSGIFQLPRGFTVSPVVDLHTGFRYSNVDVLNNYVGRPNSERFPTYFSLDMKVYRDFKIPTFVGRLKEHRFRIGVYCMNVTNRQNPRDVYNNVTSSAFGHFVGYQHRVTGMLIDIVQ